MKFFKHGGVGELLGAAVVVNPQSQLFGFSLSFINVRLNCYICINHKRDLDSRQQNPLSFHPSLPPSIIYLFLLIKSFSFSLSEKKVYFKHFLIWKHCPRVLHRPFKSSPRGTTEERFKNCWPLCLLLKYITAPVCFFSFPSIHSCISCIDHSSISFSIHVIIHLSFPLSIHPSVMKSSSSHFHNTCSVWQNSTSIHVSTHLMHESIHLTIFLFI